MALKTADLLVADYMTPRPFAVKKDTRLQDAVNIMAEHGIGNLVVLQRNRPAGILTERGILDHLVTHKKIQSIPLSKIELNGFTPVNIGFKVIDAAKLMISRKTRLLVFDDNRFVGIITATDLVRAFRRTSINPDLQNVVSRNPYSVDYNSSVLESCGIMKARRIGSVIVSRNGRPYGIFTERDLTVNVLQNGSDIKNPVGGYCTTPLISSEIGIKGRDAAGKMSKNNVKRLVITKAGKIYGIVTSRDVVDAFQQGFSDEG
ncbi:MAG: CBS domain-containing protein [Thaumarchaeota archaeon]|nr:CBS domain-containing protein [Nitrososphaerota archaeon]